MKNHTCLPIGLLFVFLTTLLSSPAIGRTSESGDFRIAFIADAHFHDVYADFQDQSFEGLHSATTGKNATIRTMQSQLMSTRLFNENYFALQAALDDIAQKNIKYVGLVGDFSDDGQPVHLRRLKQMLQSYTKTYDIRFFAVHGNHDPNRPVDFPDGKKDFLGKGGREQAIFSKESKPCKEKNGSNESELPAICTQEILQLGYEGIVDIMDHCGFEPQKEYVFWSTPYSSYTYENYAFEKAEKESALKNRTYEVCHEGAGGAYKNPSYTNCLQVEDATYLVEPVEGVWLLAIDANVYLPVKSMDQANPYLPENFAGSGNAGYNKMLTHKTHVIEWIEKVVQEAKEKGKILIPFSHYPMVDFYDNNAKRLIELFGENSLDLRRMPTDETMKALARTGFGFHLGGHMHFNDTGTREYADGSFLVNIQVPSLAAFVPGYKIVTVRNEKQIEVETIELDEVPQFNELFEHYRTEHQYLKSIDSEKIWNEKILESENYADFAQWHLTELTRKRFLPQWPDYLKEMVLKANGWELLVLSQMEEGFDQETWTAIRNQDRNKITPAVRKTWKKAVRKAEKQIRSAGMDLSDWKAWKGTDLAIDFYRLMTADQLAEKYIGETRLGAYQLIHQNLAKQSHATNPNNHVQYYFSRLFGCIDAFYQAEPSVHFLIDFSEKKVIDLCRKAD